MVIFLSRWNDYATVLIAKSCRGTPALALESKIPAADVGQVAGSGDASAEAAGGYASTPGTGASTDALQICNEL